MSILDDLHKIDPKEISFDKFNPRGESEDQIINDPDFYKLKESILNYGIIQPIIVKKKEHIDDGNNYILIDGERRLRSALDLKLDVVPSLVAENDVQGNIIAYQIHQNRKPWSKPSEAKSIRKIIESIITSNPSISDSDLKKKIIEITSHKPSSINDILKILKFDDETQKKSAINLIDHSYLIRIEDDFVSQTKKSYPEIIDSFDEDEIRKIMVRKAELGLLINTRFMMSSDFKSIFLPSIHRDRIMSCIGDFLSTPITSAKDLVDKVSSIIKEGEKSDANLTTNKENSKQSKTDNDTNNLLNSKNESGLLNCINTEAKPGENSISDCSPSSNSGSNKGSYSSLSRGRIKQTKFNEIKETLEKGAKDLSSEEQAYLKEALICFSSSALRASVLMIWSFAISKILSFIERDIAKFNTISDFMNKNKKSFYKFYASSFQTNATSIDEIRENARDMQLLCYLCHEKLITVPQLKMMKGYYDTRNDCAHPTSIDLTTNQVLAIFENLNKCIFSNNNLV